MNAPGPALQALRLDVGCGSRPRPGHAGVDVRPLPGVRFVCPAWELGSAVDAGSVESIYSRHFLEHLSFAQGALTLRVFRRLLRPGGELHLIVPDIRWHMLQFLHAGPRSLSAANARWTDRQHALAGFWGWQREGKTALWDVHKSGYDDTLLREALGEAGFVRASRREAQPWHLSMSAVAP